METPLLIINFKAYGEALGQDAVRLARLCEELSQDTGKAVAVAPAMTHLALIAREVEVPVLAQHCDNLEAGSFTGWVPVEAVKAAGAAGTLLNHAERRLQLSDLEALVRRCGALGLETVVCADNLPVARACAALGPDFVAIEPPELIGGDVSVTTAEPQVILDAVEAVNGVSRDVGILCGAGVKTGRDVSKALELGTQGVLLSSGVVKATSPKEALADLLSGL
ncbi:MAG: triose-phosphate isomerase [Thermoplasmata archaeon]